MPDKCINIYTTLAKEKTATRTKPKEEKKGKILQLKNKERYYVFVPFPHFPPPFRLRVDKNERRKFAYLSFCLRNQDLGSASQVREVIIRFFSHNAI